MKIEKLKLIPHEIHPTIALMEIKPGEAIRVKTAAEWRSMSGNLARVGKKRNVKFRTMNDGDDVLVYLA